MANRKRTQPADFAVGYKSPPKKAQFKKGKSGNPKGRPKGSRPIGAVLQDILQQRIAVTENGKTRRVPALEVMLRRLANDAMRNDPVALKLVLSMVDRYGESSQSQLRIEEMLVEDRAILAHYLPKKSDPTTSKKSNKREKRHAV